MKCAFTFPGQGSQAVGMGKALAEASEAARDVFGRVDEALKQNLSKLMWEGPLEDLTLTVNTQPALMTVSLAALAVLEKDAGLDLSKKASFLAGHSLGEYSALAAGQAMGVEEAAKLLRARGNAMQAAVPVGEGAMAALLGLDFEQAAEIAKQASEIGVCNAANDNAPGQVVVSGASDAVDRALELAKEAGARRAMRLTVSAPFHCAMMAPAADVMARELAEAEIAVPLVPLIANVTAAPVSDPATIRRLLVEQVTATVRWRESVAAMAANGVECVIEIGSGKVLTGLAKRIDRSLQALNVETPDDVEVLIKML